MLCHDSKSTILVVDDIVENLHIVHSILEPEFRIIAATNGEKAMPLAEAQSPDLILMDIIMPGQNGFEVLENLKMNPKTGQIPVIFISSLDDRETIVRGFKAGAQDYITKPFEPEELRARIGTQIRIKKQNDALKAVNETLESEVLRRTRELEKTNRRLEEANARLSHFSRIKNRFLNIVSHEFRTPMAIFSQIFSLMEAETRPEKLKEYMDDLNDAYNRLRTFSEKALLITQLDSDAYPVHPEEIRIAGIIGQSVKEFAVKSEAKRILFVRTVSEDMAIQGDCGLIGILFRSILDNAIRYSPHGGKITLSAEKGAGTTSILIRDEGAGFPEEVLLNAFDTFCLGEDPVKINMGLSLAICHMIMRMHQGEIEIRNAPGYGAEVQLNFQTH